MMAAQARLIPAPLLLALILLMGRGQARADLIPLRLSPAPPVSAEECELHGPAQPAGAPGQGSRGAGPGKKEATESEHRPQPVRTYYFNGINRLATVEAFVRRPDGSVMEPVLELGVNPNLTFPTPLGEGVAHGANNVYLVEQAVEERILKVRVGQWLTMHHSCGWGHDHKFDRQRTRSQSLNSLPLEIVIDELWDTNFHAKVTTGQVLKIGVLNHGRPLTGARVRIQTERQWVKEVSTDQDGAAAVQLIRDYYPTTWSDFKRTRRGEFLVTASYEAAEPGIYQGAPYDRVQYLATLPWHYTPARADYSSYGLGLLLGTLGLTLSGGGVFLYRERRKKPYRGISLDG